MVRTQRNCPGCQQPQYIKVGEICWQCKKDLELAKEVRAERANRAGMTVYKYNAAHYKKPGGYDTQSQSPIYKLESLVTRLVERVSQPTDGVTGDAWLQTPLLVGFRGEYQQNKTVVISLPTDLGEIIAELNTTIQAVIDTVTADGYRAGSSMLVKLSKGELTYKEVDEMFGGKA